MGRCRIGAGAGSGRPPADGRISCAGLRPAAGRRGPIAVRDPEMAVVGLRPTDAHALLAAAVRGPMDQRIRERIVAETRGNPLAILELPRDLTYAELAGGVMSGTGGLSSRIEDSFRRRLERLAPDERRLLILAAAEPLGDPVVVWRAAQRLRIPTEAAGSEAFDGLA